MKEEKKNSLEKELEEWYKEYEHEYEMLEKELKCIEHTENLLRSNTSIERLQKKYADKKRKIYEKYED